MRAIYGGYLIGAGLIFGIAATKTKYLKAGLYAVLFIVFPILVVRSVSLLVEHHMSADQLLRASMELASLVITGTVLILMRRTPA